MTYDFLIYQEKFVGNNVVIISPETFFALALYPEDVSCSVYKTHLHSKQTRFGVYKSSPPSDEVIVFGEKRM